MHMQQWIKTYALIIFYDALFEMKRRLTFACFLAILLQWRQKGEMNHEELMKVWNDCVNLMLKWFDGYFESQVG